MAYSRSRLRVRYEFEWRTFVARSWVGRKTAFCSNNDTLGHHASYALLCKVSGRLHFTLRRTDPLARLDGDEFASVAAGTDGTHGIAQLAERLVRMLAAVIFRCGADWSAVAVNIPEPFSDTSLHQDFAGRIRQHA